MMWETFNLVNKFNRYRHGAPVDLYLTLGLTLVAMVCAALVPVGDPLRTLIILPFLLVLPGYALTAALFPNQIGLAERLLLTLALSISVTVVSGLLLNLTAWGLQGTTWIVWLGGITIAACMLALARRQRYLTPNLAVNPGASAAWLPSAAATAIALVICGFALVLVRDGATQQSTAFTQFWLMPDESSPPGIEVGIRNMETESMRYKVQLLVNNQVVKEWPTITLNNGEQWVDNLVLPPEWAHASSVDAVLYRLDKPDQVYRHVWLQHNGAAQ